MRLPSAILIVALLAPASQAAHVAPRKSVLLLYDENGDFSGLASLDRSLKASLGDGISSGVDVYTEFMDISRFHDSDYELKLLDFYRKKYAGKHIDLMVGVMAPSLEFLLHHGAEIAPGTPIIFCGIDKRELAGRNLPPNMTGALVKRESSNPRSKPRCASNPRPAMSSSSPARAPSISIGKKRRGAS